VTRTAPVGGVDAGFGGAADNGISEPANGFAVPAGLAALGAAAVIAGGVGWRLSRRRAE
jgi:hypothetical protein